MPTSGIVEMMVKHVEITKEGITTWFKKWDKILYVKLDMFQTTSASLGVQKCTSSAKYIEFIQNFISVCETT
jgi:hypothetical protein